MPDNTMPDKPMPDNTERLLLLIFERRIRARIATLARRIDADYRGPTLCLVVVLTGAFVFAADLARQLATPSTTDFISASSESPTRIRRLWRIARSFTTSCRAPIRRGAQKRYSFAGSGFGHRQGSVYAMRSSTMRDRRISFRSATPRSERSIPWKDH
jgi:hypothetical protein